ILHLCLDYLFRKPEFRYAVNEHASGNMKGLEYRHLVPFFHEVSGHSKAGRPASDDCRSLSGPRRQFRYRNLAVLSLEIGGEPLEPSYGNRLSLLAYDANLLALVFLRTNPSANRRQSVRLLEFSRGLYELAFGYEPYEPRYVYVDRASADADGLFALYAPLGLFHGLLRGVAVGNLVEVPYPRHGLLLAHRLLGDFHSSFYVFRVHHHGLPLS